MSLTIARETDAFWAFDKPPGLPIHANRESSFLGLFKEEFPQHRPFLLHRLDKPTSGLLLVAKTARSASEWGRAWQEGRVIKTYETLLRGHLVQEIECNAPLTTRSTTRGFQSAVDFSVDAKAANSQFIPLRQIGQNTLCQVVIRTGRTHQIRLHAKHLGHPIAGDPLYDPNPYSNPMYLRAIELTARFDVTNIQLQITSTFTHSQAGIPI